MRGTERRKSQKLHFQEFWDSCAQNKTSEISINALSRILGLLRAEHSVGYLKSDLSGILGLRLAEQSVKNALSRIMGLVDHGSWNQDP